MIRGVYDDLALAHHDLRPDVEACVLGAITNRYRLDPHGLEGVTDVLSEYGCAGVIGQGREVQGHLRFAAGVRRRHLGGWLAE
ncbi:hypothetical protein D9M71_483620 [compost metagenome]